MATKSSRTRTQISREGDGKLMSYWEEIEKEEGKVNRLEWIDKRIKELLS